MVSAQGISIVNVLGVAEAVQDLQRACTLVGCLQPGGPGWPCCPKDTSDLL